MKNYRATLDRLSVLITAGVAILFISIAVALILFSSKEGNSASEMTVKILVNILNLLIFTFSYLLHPTGYILSDNDLIIRRPLTSVNLKYSEIKEVKTLSSSDLKWSVRTFGSGGMFGYYGKFFNNQFGPMTWYASRRDHFVLILLQKNQKIVVTPDDLSFTDDLSNRLIQLNQTSKT